MPVLNTTNYPPGSATARNLQLIINQPAPILATGNQTIAPANAGQFYLSQDATDVTYTVNATPGTWALLDQVYFQQDGAGQIQLTPGANVAPLEFDSNAYVGTGFQTARITMYMFKVIAGTYYFKVTGSAGAAF